MRIPGIGRAFALLCVSEIDEIERFGTPKKLHAYAGLVPSRYASGGRTYHGRIIKGGNKYLRWAMVEAVWPAIQTDAGLGAYYQRLVQKKGPNRAKVATARRLLTIVYRVLKERRAYEERTNLDPQSVGLTAF
jgi:transposase